MREPLMARRDLLRQLAYQALDAGQSDVAAELRELAAQYNRRLHVWRSTAALRGYDATRSTDVVCITAEELSRLQAAAGGVA